jgi:deazaflavin-dependent oxidoreductase (nitroreductase family)
MNTTMSTQPRDRAPLPRAFARFNRTVANPVMRLAAGRLPPFAIIRHRGRVTGRNYATPVLAFGTNDGLVFGVLYGTNSDWVNNLLAAGRAKVKRRGEAHQYEQPRLIGRDEGMRLVPAIIRGPFRLIRVRNFVRLTVSPPMDPSAHQRPAPGADGAD